MKTMTCRQLGGACDAAFQAETFEEMATLSKQHGTEMFQKGDPEHMRAMEEMRGLISDPKTMNDWMEKKRVEFEELPEDS